MLIVMPPTHVFGTTIIGSMIVVALIVFYTLFLSEEPNEHDFNGFVSSVIGAIIAGLFIGGILGLILFIIIRHLFYS